MAVTALEFASADGTFYTFAHDKGVVRMEDKLIITIPEIEMDECGRIVAQGY